MQSRLKSALSYLLFWIFFFVVGRIVFLLYQHDFTEGMNKQMILETFVHGSKMDLSAAAYISVFFFVLISFSPIIPSRILKHILWVYTVLVTLFCSLLIIADLPLFQAWGFRIDKTPLRYLSNPTEAWASSENAPILLLVTIAVLLISGTLFTMKRFLFSKFKTWKPIQFFPFTLLGLLLTGLLIIPIRGGLGIAPMNQSAVYFSNNNFANLSAINPVWNFIASLLNEEDTKNPFVFLDTAEAKIIVDSLYKSDGEQKYVLDTSIKNPNVLIIIWESFTKKGEGLVYKNVQVTPQFEQLKKEGIYFSNLYAVGDRTDKGLTGVLSGYPSQPTASIIMHPTKTSKMNTLSKDFKGWGYETRFYYGGESNFANIKSYLLQGGIDRIEDVNSYPARKATSKWGVHDEFTFERYLEDHKKPGVKPFFEVFLTLSSHEPFETTRPVAIPGDDLTSKFLNSLHYTDEMLGNFIAKAKTEPWWDNTLIIIVADHGHPLPDEGSKLANFTIPMLWLGGMVKQPLVYDKVASQIDIAATLLGQLNRNTSNYPWSKNLFKTHKSWAFFTFNNGFGFINPKESIIYDNVGKQLISGEHEGASQAVKQGQALVQLTFQDYLDK